MINANADFSQPPQQNQCQNVPSFAFLVNAPVGDTANGIVQPLHHQLNAVHQQQHKSVIVHTQQQQQMPNETNETAQNNGKQGERKRRGRKRKRREAEGEEEQTQQAEEADGEGDDGRRGGHGTLHSTVPSPRAIGVRRFIDPFEDTVRIPLPHELEMSTQGTTVWRRNERERQRVQLLNSGFSRLREQLPLIDRDRRMSKVDSLRLAIAYIRHLQLILEHSHAHWAECNCFKQSYGGGDGRSSGTESTPPPN